MKLQFLHIVSWIALVAYHIPMIFVILKKLWKDTPILMFALYWSVGGITNLAGNLDFISAGAYRSITVVHNMLDVPFVLFIFMLNTNVPKIRSMSRVMIPFYLFVEIIIGFISGFKPESFNYMNGVGVLFIIAVTVMEVIEYFKKMSHTDREKATIFLFFALLFEYMSYLFVYLVAKYWKNDEPDPESEPDEMIIYYVSTLLGIIIACFGFMSDNLRKKAIKAPSAPRPHEVLISIID
ncbi:MAG: hypothetical protein EOO02_15880 [Chitinophagaceae bacterium]|nr:MAG: hypothetical protein EOO02_15880 [Chitinophagaceae bacterium]